MSGRGRASSSLSQAGRGQTASLSESPEPGASVLETPSVRHVSVSSVRQSGWVTPVATNTCWASSSLYTTYSSSTRQVNNNHLENALTPAVETNKYFFPTKFHFFFSIIEVLVLKSVPRTDQWRLLCSVHDKISDSSGSDDLPAQLRVNL